MPHLHALLPAALLFFAAPAAAGSLSDLRSTATRMPPELRSYNLSLDGHIGSSADARAFEEAGAELWRCVDFRPELPPTGLVGLTFVVNKRGKLKDIEPTPRDQAPDDVDACVRKTLSKARVDKAYAGRAVVWEVQWRPMKRRR